MTTPNQTSPDGAIVVGGGQWLYGQTVNEDTARAAFELPMPTPDNMLDLLRIVLESLPIEALQPFADFLGVVDGVFTTAGEAVESILGSFNERFLPQFETFLSEITNLDSWLVVLKQVVDFFAGLIADVSSNALAIIGELVEFFSDLFDGDGSIIEWFGNLGGSVISAVLGEFETFLTAITNRTAWLAALKNVIDFFATITNFSTWSALLKQVIDFFATVTNFSTWSTTFKALIDGLLGIANFPAWVSVFKTVVDTFVTLLAALGSNLWTVLTELITFFSGKFTEAGSVLQWIKDNIVKLPAGNLVGQIADNVLGLVNIGHLTTQPVNLLSSPGFNTLSTISPVDGWSWDSSQTATGSGGSAKVVCDGYNKELSHQTAVRVAAGDIMQLSAAVKTSSVTGTGWKASISLMEYRDGAIATPVEIASRSSNTSAWVTISGGYTVPANVSSVVFRLTVTDALSGTVWFDDLDIHKSGAIVQDWVENLNNTWQNMWSGQFGDGTGVGKTWADMGTAIRSGRDNTTLAKGAGDEAHADLRTTRNSLYDGFTLGAGATGKTAADLGAFGKVVRQQADLGVGNAALAAGAASVADGKAVTADGKAVDVATGIRRTVGGEPGTTGVPASAGTYLGNLITKMYGTGATVPLAAISNNAIVDLPTTRLSGTISQGQITDGAVSTAKLASNVVSGITNSVLSSTVGSGLTINRNNSAAAYPTLSGQRRIASGFYNATGRTSTDVTVSTSSGFYAINITNPGWYMIDMGFLLTGQNYHSYNWWFRPLFFKGADTGNFYKCGTEVININYSRTPANSKGPSCAQASWIEYLTAGDTIWPGYLWTNQDSVASDNIITTAASQFGTYFSISLLNRSLA